MGGVELILRQAATNLTVDLSYQGFNRLRLFAERGIARQNPLFQAATRQAGIMVPWYAFPGANSVRVTQTMVDQQARIVEQRATPEQVLADMASEVRRLLPRPRG